MKGLDFDLQGFLDQAADWIGAESGAALWRAVAVLALGFLLAKLANRRLRTRLVDDQQQLLIRRLVTGVITIVSVTWALRELGFSLGPLLGAAGVLTVALGFASQTSVSNVISGLFLMGERPFVSGDVVQVNNTTGEVLSVGLMSVKMRTFDNVMVRIPNETMLKSDVTNFTHFPIRRADIRFGVAHREQVSCVREVLMALADRHPRALTEPAPQFFFLGFGASSIDLQFSVWSKQEGFIEWRNEFTEQVKETLDREGIELARPHVVLYAGSATGAMPIEMREPERKATS